MSRVEGAIKNIHDCHHGKWIFFPSSTANIFYIGNKLTKEVIWDTALLGANMIIVYFLICSMQPHKTAERCLSNLRRRCHSHIKQIWQNIDIENNKMLLLVINLSFKLLQYLKVHKDKITHLHWC